MSMSSTEIAHVVETLQRDLSRFESSEQAMAEASMPWGPSVRVREVHDDGSAALSLTLRAPGQNLVLTAGTTPAHLRLYVGDERVRSGEAPRPFTAQLRRRLSGAVLTALSMPDPNDRIVVARFVSRRATDGDDASVDGELERLCLWFELTGRNANLVLTDGDDLILGADNPRLARAGTVREPPAPPPAPKKGAKLRFRAPAQGAWASLQLGAQIAAHYTTTIAFSERRTRVRGLRQGARRAAKRARRRLAAVESDLARANASRRDRELGDLLAANYHALERGMSTVTVPDLYAAGAPIEIALDPAASPRENVDRYYSRHRKYEAARSQIQARLSETEDLVLELELALESMDAWTPSATDPPDDVLDAMAASLRKLGVRAPERGSGGRSERRKRAAAARARAALPYRRFESSTGREILVGKSARDNDALTFRVARGNDLWLHASGAAGSHVIVRLGRGEDVDETTLAEAAMLAAHYSKASRGTWAEVHYARQHGVRKVRGGAPGLVTLAGARTIEVELDPDRLTRLKTQSGDDEPSS